MSIGHGFGKIILIGDQFINYGVPAIVSTLELRTKAIVKRAEGETWKLQDNRKETPGYKKSKSHQQKESIQRIFQAMKIDPSENPMEIIFGGDLIAASGLGASAASCVALARALNAEFEMGLGDEEINNIAFEGEKAYHGVPSGVDNTASTLGGMMLFRKDRSTGSNITERIHLSKGVELVVADSGVVANTASIVAYVRDQMMKQPEKIEAAVKRIKEKVFELRRHLEDLNLVRVGELMTEYHKVIIELGLSHEKLIDMCKLACENGALGAKLTGGGRGGNMIALTPGVELQESVARALEREGYRTLRVTIGRNKEICGGGKSLPS